MKKLHLPKEYAQILFRIRLAGKTDLMNLAESLRIDQARLTNIVRNLQHKGLILVRRYTGSDAWVELSAKGQRLLQAQRGLLAGLPA